MELIVKNKDELFVLAILCVLDIISGVANACIEKKVSSKKFKKGIIGKLFEFIVVIIANVIDYILQYDCMTNITIVFYIMYEVMSILENTSKFVPYPQSLKDILEKYSKKGDDDGDTR